MSELSRCLYERDTYEREAHERESQAAVGFTSRRVSRGNEWSSEHVRLLREMAATGSSLETIATALRRTTSAIRNKAGMHGISLKARR